MKESLKNGNVLVFPTLNDPFSQFYQSSAIWVLVQNLLPETKHYAKYLLFT